MSTDNLDLSSLGDDGGSPDFDFDGPDTQTLGISTTLLPLTILGVVAFLHESVVASSLAAVGFTGLALDALVATFSVLGLLTVGGIGLLAFLTVVAFLVAIIRRSIVATILGLLGVGYFAAAGAIGYFVFSGLPLLVGFVIGSTLLIYGGMLVVAALFGAGLIAIVSEV